MTWTAFLLLLGTSAACAFLLACAVSLAYWRPRPVRSGFEVRYEHLPCRRHDNDA